MIKKTVTLRQIVKLLNELVVLDRDAMTNLIASRVSCNEKLANHPTVQVGAYNHETGEPTPGKFQVGILGILNGMFGIDEKTGYGAITAVFEGTIPKLGKVMEFRKTNYTNKEV